MSESKIVQICCDEYRLYGLSSEGVVWQYDGSSGWDKLPPLPADGEPLEREWREAETKGKGLRR